ncbi:hypothetical protein [Streptomyces sp. cmx-4-9]|uniref:hypothetical protein n=1 Tax=Streptomyces sp. cmx-4-9 TaxID=2790941 RepID=UPI003980187A
MAEHKKSPTPRDLHQRRTTPSDAEGESGDREARKQADEAVVRNPAEGDADAGGHSAKSQRPGIGREEQDRPDH